MTKKMRADAADYCMIRASNGGVICFQLPYEEIALKAFKVVYWAKWYRSAWPYEAWAEAESMLRTGWEP